MRYLFIFSIFLSPFISIASTTSADKILGIWLTEIKDGKVEIYKSNGKYHGKIVWVKEPNDDNGNPKKDKHNPKTSLKSQPILNLVIIKNLVYSDGKWSGGTVYDPKDGKSYDCSMWFENGNLKLRGYIGWFYDTKTWTRVK